MGLKSNIYRNVINMPGFRTKRKLVVLESDDWGSIRMPSIAALERLKRKNVSFDLSIGYDCVDTIASKKDLTNLFEICGSVNDLYGNPVVITANCVVANPDFSKIEASGFNEYHYEIITDTMDRYYGADSPFELWKKGLDENLFHPQFHGREHLNVLLWMDLLKSNNFNVKESFKERLFGMTYQNGKGDEKFVLGAYDYSNVNQQLFIQNSISEGTNIFQTLFGFKSKSAIAPCYIWDDFVEKVLFDEGVEFIQGGPFQWYSEYQKEISGKKGKYHFTGQKSKNGQIYMVRNAYFEPSQNRNFDYVSDCMNRIATAFFWGKPAIISTHRLNFIGELNEKNRDLNLREFKKLLFTIKAKYPEVEFVSSDKLGTIILDKICAE